MNPRKVILRLLGFVVLLAAILVAWLCMLRMPGKNFEGPAEPLGPEQIALRDELAAHVQKLAGEIGERNERHYAQLNAAVDYIEDSLSASGYQPKRDSYDLRERTYYNIEAEIRGAAREIVLIGAHYDSVLGSPGANDNGSGVAAMLALARRFANKSSHYTVRFLAFVNEEPPYFQSSEMGSFVYASRCKARGDQIRAMLSLETIGYFSNLANSQTYPLPGLGRFYPKTGNFIGFVGNVRSRALLRRAIAQFREHAKISSQGAALPAAIPGVAWSDQWSFWKQGYPGIMITDTALFRYPDYHAATDTPDRLDYDSMTRVVEGLRKVIEGLANARE
jgi:Iap family predicted aminopeptidase